MYSTHTFEIDSTYPARESSLKIGNKGKKTVTIQSRVHSISSSSPSPSPPPPLVRYHPIRSSSSASKLASSSSARSGSLPPSRLSNHSGGTAANSPLPPANTSFGSSTSSKSTNNLSYYREAYYRMSYVLVSTEDFHRGPTRISTIDPYLHEKVPFTVIKDSLYFQAEPKYDPHGRYWKFRVEDAPVRVLNKLLDLGYKVLTGTSMAGGSFDSKQPGHAWTLMREPSGKYSANNSH